MKALPGRIVAKGGAEGAARLRDPARPAARGATVAGYRARAQDRGRGRPDRATSAAASVEALAQAGVLDGQALRIARAATTGPIGSTRTAAAAEAIAAFELAPVGELLG